MSGYTLGVDIGTTGTKTVLFDVTAGIVAQTTRESTLLSPFATAAEVDPAQWFENVVDSITELVATSGVHPNDITAIATSGMVPAVVLVGSDGQPVRPAILQNDARATREVTEIAAATEDVDLVTITGSGLTQQSVAPSVLWFRRNEPQQLARTRWIMGSYDWVLVALGASPHVEHNWALESGLFDVATLRPVPAIVHAAEIDTDMLPEVAKPGQVVGSLSEEIAARTGLSTEVKLVVGGADHVLSAYAAGVEKNGDWLVKLGGAGDILVASDEMITDQRIYLDAHPVPGRWLPNGCMATSGSLVKWFRSLTGGMGFEELEAEAAARQPAQAFCLPYFLGEKSPLHDPNLRGAYVGLHLGLDRGDMHRATMEAIAYGFRHHVEVFNEIGLDLGQAMVTNGGSKSRLWKQIHADVLNTELFPVADHPGASLAAAAIAAIGVGGLSSWSDISAFVKLEEPVVPNEERVRIYDDAYAQWRQIGEVLTPISHTISGRSS